MKQLMKKAITALAVAVGITTAAQAGENPAIWYKFDGNYDASGASTLSFGGEKAGNWGGALNGQALMIVDGATHPYGGGWNFGSGAWAVTVSAVPVANANNKIVLWATGVKGGWFGLLSDSANNKAVLAYGNASGATEICSVAVPNITATFHLYAVRCDGAGNYELIVDDDVAGKGAAAYAGSIPSGTYQIGAVNGGLPTGLARTTGTLIDDLRIYQRALADAEIAEIKDILIAPTHEVISINIGGGRGTGELAANSDHLVSAYCGLAPAVAAGWNNIPYQWNNGGTTKEIAVGSVKASDGVQAIDLAGVSVYVSANNTYDGGKNRYNAFHKGYLDDGDYNGHKAYVKVSGIPYAKYDVIVYTATDSSGGKFGAVKVNGTSYTWSDGATVAGDAAWGDSNATATELGKNALRITGIKTTDVEIEGTKSGGRGGIAAVQIVEAGIDYTLSMSADQALSTAVWTPAKTRAFNENDTITITATANATFTFDESFTLGKLSVVSAAGKMLTFKRNSDITADVGALDFSGAADGIGWDATEGYTACTALKDCLQNSEAKVTFYGDGENGATVEYARAGTKVFKSHIVFDGGKHSFTYGQNNERNFADNATADNPTILVKDGTTLDFYGHDLCGWSGTANTAAIIQVEDGGKLYMKQAGGEGTVYYRQRLTLDPGAEFYVDMQANNFRLQGGVSEEKAQLYVPAGSGIACIKPVDAARDSIYLAKDATRNFAAFVGAGATLDIQTKIACQEDDVNKNDFEIGKYGEGLLKLSGDISGYWPQGYDKVVKFSTYAGDIELASATEAKCRFWLNSSSTLRLTGNGTTVSGLITGGGNVVCNSAGTVTLTAANDYAGTTTVSAGALTLAAGATLGSGNYTVAEGATLNLGTHRPTTAKLVDESAGTVGITLTAEELATFDEGEEMTLEIPVEGDELACTIKVYDLQGTEYLIQEPEVLDGKIVIQKDLGAKVSPFNLTVTEESEMNEGSWEQFPWLDSNSEDPQQVNDDDWDLKVGANITVSDETEVIMDLDEETPITLTTLNIRNSSKLTIAPDEGQPGTLTADAIDDSASTGTTTLDFATGAANVTAGADTVVRGSGTGALTIGADKTATIMDGVWAGAVTRDNASTIRYAGTAGTAAVPYTTGDANMGLVIYAADFGDLGDDGLQFKNTLTRKFEDGFVVTGGRFVTGNQAGHTQNITMDGGSITVTGSTAPTSSKSSTLFAHWDSTVNFTMNGGTFTAENAAVRLGWDGKAYFTQNGGTFRTKGIKSGDERNGAASYTLSGGTLELGDYGINGAGTAAAYTFAGGTVRAYANTSINVKHADGMKVTGPVTLDANGFSLTIEGKVTGDGNITVIDSSEGKTGSVAFSGDLGGYTGTIDFSEDFAEINLGLSRPTNAFGFAAENPVVRYTENLADDGVMPPALALAEGSSTPTYKMFGADGVEKVVADGRYAPTVSGGACLLDYTFTNTVQTTGGKTIAPASTSQQTGNLTGDSNTSYTRYNEETGWYEALFTQVRPYRGYQLSAPFSVAVAGCFPASAKTAMVSFGSSVNNLFLASGEAEDTVQLVRVNGHCPQANNRFNIDNCEVLTTMKVPNAATTQHTVVFETTDLKTIVIYLDGIKWSTYAFAAAQEIGSGIQVGGWYGGSAYDDCYHQANDTTATESYLSAIRIYGAALGPNAIRALSGEFPYISPNGSYSRTLPAEASASWTADRQWKNDETEETVDAPAVGAAVTLTGSAATAVGVNLAEDTTYEAITLDGAADQVLTIAATEGYSGKIRASGQVTISAPVMLDYAAIDIAGVPLTLTENGAINFILTSIDLGRYFASKYIPLTGVASEDYVGRIGAVLPAEVEGRTRELVYDEATQTYGLQITVEVHPFVYEDGVWTWNGQEMPAETVMANADQVVVVRSDLEWPMDRAEFTVEAGTLKATRAGSSSVTVEAGATFDLNGLGGSAYAITLAGGALVNTGARLNDVNTFTTLTLTADSTLGGTSGFTMQKAGYAATTIDLGEFTLTKEGTNQISIVATTVNGTGTLLVEEGTLYSSESTAFTNGVLKIGKDGTLWQRSGRTMTVANVVGEGGTLNNEGTISAFTLTGSLKFANAGSYGAVTLADGATLDVGKKRGLTLAGEGTVNVALTDEEFNGTALPVTVFTAAEGANVKIGTVTHNGSVYSVRTEGGQIVRILRGMAFYLK